MFTNFNVTATCEDIPALLCNLACTAPDDATCVDHIAAGGETIEVSSVEQADGSCGCPSGYKLDLISNNTQLLCHKRKNCACTGPDGQVHQVSFKSRNFMTLHVVFKETTVPNKMFLFLFQHVYRFLSSDIWIPARHKFPRERHKWRSSGLQNMYLLSG